MEVTKISSPSPCQESSVWEWACSWMYLYVCAGRGTPEGLGALTQHPLGYSGEKKPKPLIPIQAESQEPSLGSTELHIRKE